MLLDKHWIINYFGNFNSFSIPTVFMPLIFTQVDLHSDWLKKNISKSQERLRKCEPVREEIIRLQREISAGLGIAKLILDCGWNIRHYRGCLASFQNLAHHHPKEMEILKGILQDFKICFVLVSTITKFWNNFRKNFGLW